MASQLEPTRRLQNRKNRTLILALRPARNDRFFNSFHPPNSSAVQHLCRTGGINSIFVRRRIDGPGTNAKFSKPPSTSATLYITCSSYNCIFGARRNKKTFAPSGSNRMLVRSNFKHPLPHPRHNHTCKKVYSYSCCCSRPHNWIKRNL